MVVRTGVRRGLGPHFRRDRYHLRRLCGAWLLGGRGVPLDRWSSGGPLRHLADRPWSGLKGTSRRGRVHAAPAEGARLSHLGRYDAACDRRVKGARVIPPVGVRGRALLRERALGTHRIRAIERKGDSNEWLRYLY